MNGGWQILVFERTIKAEGDINSRKTKILRQNSAETELTESSNRRRQVESSSNLSWQQAVDKEGNIDSRYWDYLAEHL